MEMTNPFQFLLFLAFLHFTGFGAESFLHLFKKCISCYHPIFSSSGLNFLFFTLEVSFAPLYLFSPLKIIPPVLCFVSSYFPPISNLFTSTKYSSNNFYQIFHFACQGSSGRIPIHLGNCCKQQ